MSRPNPSRPARRTVLRSVLAAAAASIALFGVVAPVGAQDAPSTTTSAPPVDHSNEVAPKRGVPDTPSGDPAIDDLVGCVRTTKRLLVLIVMDESASLQTSDPQNRRVDAAQGALDSLVALGTSAGTASPKVDVALAAFSNDYRLVKDWTPATPATAPTLRRSIARFAKLNHGYDTDFVNVLSSGRKALADQAAVVTAEGDPAPCRAALLFTDGGFAIAVRTNAEEKKRLGLTKTYAPDIPLTSKANVRKAEAAGRNELCREGGVADRLRRDDVTLLTVALSKGITRRAQVPLAAATAGIAEDGYKNAFRCGTPTDRTPGAYLPAAGVDTLVVRFNEVGTRLAGGNLLPGSDQVKVCKDETCDEGKRNFTLDKTLRRAEIVSLASRTGTAVEITGPDGSKATVSEPGAGKVGDVPYTARGIAGRGFSIDLDRPAADGSWTGEWTAAVVDPAGTREGDEATLQIFLFSDIGVSVPSATPFERGKSSKITAKLVLPKGTKASSIVAVVEAELRLHNPVTNQTTTVKMTGTPNGSLQGTYRTPASTTSNLLQATVEAHITTKTGAALVEQSPSTEFLVRRSKGSIQFAPGTLEMPSVTGKGSTETDLLVLGGDKPGCIWFGPSKIDAPEGAGTIQVNGNDAALPTKGDCLAIPAKVPTTVTISAKPSGRASGTVRGTLQVFERTGSQTASRTDIPLRFDLSAGVDQARRLLLAVLLLIAGLVLPMLALLVINQLTARFQTLDVVRGAAIPIIVSGRVIRRVEGNRQRALNLRDSDFGSLAGTGDDKSFRFGGVDFRARASRNPFGEMIAMAVPEGGAEKLKNNEGSRVDLDSGLAGSWVFLLDSDKTRRAPRGESHGLLVAFNSEGDATTQTMRMLEDINDKLPDIAIRLAALVREATPRAPKPTKPSKDAAADAPVAEDAPPADDGAVDEGIGDEPPAEPATEPEPEPDAEAEADEPPAAPAAPAAPAGFGGTAKIDPPPAPPVPDADDDDGPAAPPTGFGGTRPGA